MPQRASVTDSPSNSKINRSTPCVDGMLWTHVDHDSLVAALGLLGDDGVPVLPGDGVDVALGRVGRGTEGILLLSQAAGPERSARRSCS